MVSQFAFKFNLRRYTTGVMGSQPLPTLGNIRNGQALGFASKTHRKEWRQGLAIRSIVPASANLVYALLISSVLWC